MDVEWPADAFHMMVFSTLAWPEGVRARSRAMTRARSARAAGDASVVRWGGDQRTLATRQHKRHRCIIPSPLHVLGTKKKGPPLAWLAFARRILSIAAPRHRRQHLCTSTRGPSTESPSRSWQINIIDVVCAAHHHSRSCMTLRSSARSASSPELSTPVDVIAIALRGRSSTSSVLGKIRKTTPSSAIRAPPPQSSGKNRPTSPRAARRVRPLSLRLCAAEATPRACGFRRWSRAAYASRFPPAAAPDAYTSRRV